MAPQLYITVYKEHFTSPGRVTREQLRPTSANRRNNPQPRPDFLFPRTLQSCHSSRPTPPHPPVDRGRPLLPPVKRLSFHSPPVMTRPDNCINRVGRGKPIHMPPVNPSSVPPLPSADKLRRPQPTESPAGPGFNLYSALKNPASGCYSCFHVVKSYQAGDYTIHPEFVSEGLRYRDFYSTGF